MLSLEYSVSMTTRKPREGEVNGKDYFFVTEKEFKDHIANGNFLEYAEFVGNYYGTPKDKVEELRNAGKNVFLEIEIKGASQVLQNVKDDRVISFFLMPPSFEALENRIRKRKSESEAIIQERLQKGKNEMTMTQNYDYIILNDKVGRAAKEIVDLVKKKDAEE